MRRLILMMSLFAVAVSPTFARRYSDAEWKTLFLKHPNPDYPAAYRMRHLTGSGVYRIYVDEHGQVTKIGILESTGHRELDLHVMKTLIGWRAVPGPKREIDTPISFGIGR
jgi:protein TonB